MIDADNVLVYIAANNAIQLKVSVDSNTSTICQSQMKISSDTERLQITVQAIE